MTQTTHQIRALQTPNTIRVYQAYNDHIAETALALGTFKSPPFKVERMTWIKPSFLWMMYRADWGKKDPNQNRILAIDISKKWFEWALENSLLAKQSSEFSDKSEWLRLKKQTPVRIQWDPERDLYHRAQIHRSIQIGLTGKAVPLYVNEWIQDITDVTSLAHTIHQCVKADDIETATQLLPNETVYQPPEKVIEKLRMGTSIPSGELNAH